MDRDHLRPQSLRIRAQIAIAHERRTVFELEVLRQLMDLADNAEPVHGGGFGEPFTIPPFENLFMEGKVESRLAFFGPEELPLWRSIANKYSMIGAHDESIPAPPPELIYEPIGDDGEEWLDAARTRVALHADVLAAVRRRVVG